MLSEVDINNLEQKYHNRALAHCYTAPAEVGRVVHSLVDELSDYRLVVELLKKDITSHHISP